MIRAALRSAAVVVCLWSGGATAAVAQTAGPGPQRGSWELGGGVVFIGGFDLGDRAAELTRNTGGPSGPFELFTTESRITSVPGLQARIGYYVSNDVLIEGSFRFAQPVLEVEISGDAEDAPDETADETLSQYVIDVSAVWHFGRFGGGRGAPFLIAGSGYLRELHEGDELVETGTTFHAGAGFKYWFGATGRAGLRAEGGVSFRDGGFDFEDGLRAVPVVGASVVFRF